MKIPKYMKRLLLFGLLLGTFPVMTLGILSYINATGTVQKKVLEGNNLYLEQSQMRVENILQSTDRTILQFVYSTLVQEMLSESRPNYQLLLNNRLKQELQSMKTLALSIDEFQLVNLKERWYVDENGMHPLFKWKHLNEIEQYRNVNAFTFWRKSDASGVNMLQKMPHYPHFKEKLEGIVFVHIPGKELNKLIPNGQGNTYILDENNQLIAESGPKDANTAAASSEGIIQSLSAKLTGETGSSGYFKQTFEGSDLGITFRKSGYNGWTYVSVVSIQAINKQSGMIGWFTLIISGSIILMTMLISLFVSRKMYSPIQKLYESVVGLTKIGQPGKTDEFSILTEHFGQLLQSKKEMNEKYAGQLKNVKELFMLKLYLGQVTEYDLHNYLDMFHHGDRPKQMGVITLQIDSIEGTRYRKRDETILLFAVNNIVGELVPDCRPFLPVFMDRSQVTFIFGNYESDESFLNEAYQIAEHIQAAVKHYLKLKVSIGISDVFHDYLEAAGAYRKGLEALEYRLQLGEELIIPIHKVKRQQAFEYMFPEKVYKELFELIKLCDAQRTDACLRRLITEVLGKQSGPGHWRLFVIRLAMDLISELQNHTSYNLTKLFADDENLFQQLLELKTVEATMRWFTDKLIDPLIQAIQKSQDSHLSSISDSMLNLIHLHFDKDISLEYCASQLNYHPNYIKRVFRQKVGVSFSEYLAQHRLKIAKQWLNQTDMKITEMAERLTYSNVQNFSRYFKKMEGVSPAEYRDRYAADAKELLP
jgi:AraC-like DNA-binding protein